jgi:hypothetical protein
MQTWEYFTCFLYANAENQREFFKRRWPNWNPPQYAPQAMIPKLNELGQEGWELVHIEPVASVGKNYDVFFAGAINSWSNCYFCVFKRPMSSAG